jgi:phage regulator Rha-like protein
MDDIIPAERIENRIYLIRGQKVMLDRDLAELYGVKTKALNQAVKRNPGRFPSDFMFQLNREEKNRLVTNCDRFEMLKHSSSLPYAFNEQGIAMLSSVINSEKAIQVNVAIIRIFVKLRRILSTHKKLAQKFKELEDKLGKHDVEIQAIFDVLRRLMAPEEKTIKKIGFV